jgi:hypothetical protein
LVHKSNYMGLRQSATQKEYELYCACETIIALKKKFSITALFCVITVLTISAQQSNQNDFRKQAIQNLIGLYYQSLDAQAEIYNAPLYERHIPAFTSGHPFFFADSFSVGSIGYNGLVYEDVPILYDIVRDELVTRSPKGFTIALIKPKVDSFFFAGHSFIKLNDDTSGMATQSYYERLYNGNIQFLVKRKKTVQVSSGVTALEKRIYVQDRYYLYRNGLFEQIKNKNSLLSALKDKRNALQQFIKQNNLKLKQNFEEDAVRVVAYYNQLN